MIKGIAERSDFFILVRFSIRHRLDLLDREVIVIAANFIFLHDFLRVLLSPITRHGMPNFYLCFDVIVVVLSDQIRSFHGLTKLHAPAAILRSCVATRRRRRSV